MSEEPRVFRPQLYWHPPTTELTFRPEAGQYDLMPAEELSMIVKDMKENGFNQNFPIGLLKGEILWGRNRYLAAKKANVEFLTVTLPDDTDPQAGVERENEWRRHLTPEWLQRKRQARIGQVAAARQEGKSIRTIAEEVGVSKTQVEADIKASTVQGVDSCPENGKVMGKDKRERPATMTPKDGPTKRGKKTPKVEKNGAIIFHWSEFFSAYGTIVRAIDKIGNGYHCKESAAAEACRAKLQAFKDEFTKWVEFHTKSKAPRF